MSSPECYPEKAPKADNLLDTLSDSLRREIVHYFENLADEETESLEGLVAYLDDRVPGTNPEMLEAQLLHLHLPKLRERGWIDYDTRSGTIRYQGHGSAAELLEDVLEVFTE